MQGWIAAVVTVVAMVWVAAFGLAATAPPSTTSAANAAERFLPPDGYAQRVTVDGAPAVSESARGTGVVNLLPLPGPLKGFVPPSGTDPATSLFWRESVQTAEGTAALRQYVTSPAGVWLMLDDQRRFDGGLLVLPADVAAGRTWSARGTARTAAGTVDIETSARAAEAADPVQRSQGCLDVATTVRGAAGPARGAAAGPDGAPTGGEQVATWCPGRGVVAGTPVLGLARIPTDRRPQVAEPAPRPAPSVDTPTLVRPVPESGLPGLGWVSTDPSQQPATAAAALADGTVAIADAGSTTITGWRPQGTADRPLLRTRWWAEPGGLVNRIDAVGPRLFVTTSTKNVVAYDAVGRRLWRVTLPDLAPSGVTALGTDRIVVATLSGHVQAYAVTDGRRLWSTDIGGSAAAAPTIAGDRVLVMTGEDGLTAVDATTGKKLWDQAEASGAAAVSPDGSPVALHQGGQAWRYDATSGDVVDGGLVAVGRHNASLLAGHGYVAAQAEADLTLFDPGTLAESGHVPGVIATAVTRTGWLAITRTQALVLAPNGDVRARVPLGLTAKAVTLWPRAEGFTLLVTRPGATGTEALWLT